MFRASALLVTIVAATLRLALTVQQGAAALPVSSVAPIVRDVPHITPTFHRHHGKRVGHNSGVIRGVNIGGWLVIEPWIRPSLFQRFINQPKEKQAIDEWTYCEILGKSECYMYLKHHWDEWFTAGDVQHLASAGINHIRIPIGYWAFNTTDSEPYVSGQTEYLEKAIRWAREYNLNVILDLHGVPGSQNGFDNSGRRGPIKWQESSLNIERTLKALEELTRIAAKYGDTVDIIEYVNEPASWGLDMNEVVEFYNQAYQIVRNIMPNVDFMFHDSFLPLNDWHSLRNPQWQNTIIDTHIYHVFTREDITRTPDQHLQKAREDGENIANFNLTMPVVTGEWSLATSDCAKWLNGFGNGARWDGTLEGQPQMCAPTSSDGEFDSSHCQCTGDASNHPSEWSVDYWDFLKRFARAQIDAYERGAGWVFWNFKTESAPQWDYLFLTDFGIIPHFEPTVWPGSRH